jgi:putative ABC transport system permease protein
MIRHYFRLFWNRRRSNVLILVELFACFLVLCGVLTVAASFWDRWMKPLGFDTEGVWQMDLAMPEYQQLSDEKKAEAWEVSRQLDLLLKGTAEIEAFTPMSINTPCGRSMMGESIHANGHPGFLYLNEVTPAAREVLGLALVSGRWLEAGDGTLNWRPCVITRNCAEDLFPGEDAVGKTLPAFDRDGKVKGPEAGARENRVVGIVKDCRWRGDFYPEAYLRFSHAETGLEDWPPQNYLFRVRPSVAGGFEERLVREVQGLATGWSVTLAPLSRHRQEARRDQLAPLLLGALVSGFLILMVGLGLVGVLWQMVSRRTEEWGLRRALGATVGRVRMQVLGEIWALTTVAVGAGAVLFVQLPLFQAFRDVPLHVYLMSLAGAALLIYLVVALCGLYPSWLATRADPAEALQHE